MVKDSDSSSMTQEADCMERLTLDSSPEPSLNKPLRSYIDETLPDLLRSGSPLRRRASCPVSNMLKQMRKEVELSRRRSLKIKAQKRAQDGETDDNAAILQQALQDRDEALEKIKALETELLTSKKELMTLNNQLLEAVQRQLEMAIELEAWKDDMQAILQHQLQQQQLAEQAQKKSKGFRGLRRKKQQPSPAPAPAPSPATTSISQLPNNSFFEPQSPGSSSREDSFQTVSLD